MLHSKLPKIKKKLSLFLSDESGEISSKDILGLGIWAMLITSGVNTTNALYGVPCSWHSSGGAPTSGGWPTHGNMYYPGCSHSNVWHASWSTPGHASTLVNWQYSITPPAAGHASRWAVSISEGWHGSHGSHGSHGYHGSHGSHSSY